MGRGAPPFIAKGEINYEIVLRRKSRKVAWPSPFLLFSLKVIAEMAKERERDGHINS